MNAKISGAIEGLKDACTDVGRMEVCKTLWETFQDFTDSHEVDRFTVSLLDDLKYKLAEVLPYGPDEVC